MNIVRLKIKEFDVGGSQKAPVPSRGNSRKIYEFLLEMGDYVFDGEIFAMVENVKCSGTNSKLSTIRLALTYLIRNGYVVHRRNGAGTQYCSASLAHYNKTQQMLPSTSHSRRLKPTGPATSRAVEFSLIVIAASAALASVALLVFVL